MESTVMDMVEILWNYMKMNFRIQISDSIIVYGSHDKSVAHRGVDLYFEGWSEHILFSGGFGYMTDGVWKVTEAETFAEIAVNRGIPESAIMIENQSTNTGENVEFSLKTLNDHGIFAKNLILVHKPYMERRTYATFRKRSPNISISVTSPHVSLFDYISNEKSIEVFINTLVGDFQRIDLYARLGFQIPQYIPDDVRNAYENLVERGFCSRIIV